MKKLNYLLVLVAFLTSASLFAQVTNTVTFKADMNQLITDGFDASVDVIQIEGLTWDGDAAAVTVEGDRKLTAGDGNIFSTTLTISSAWGVGDSLRWKFRAVDPNDKKFVNGGWEGGFGDYDGYALHLQADGSTFELDPLVPGIEVVKTGLGIQNTINFSADISGIIGSGAGFFDPESDVLMVKGLDWDGLGTLISDPADRNLKEDEFTPGLFTTSLTVEAPEGATAGNDSTKWKFFADPGGKFSNGGWELGPDRWHVYQDDKSVIDLPVIVPNITPLLPPVEEPLKVRFQVDMNYNPVNAVDTSEIPLDKLSFVCIRGADSALGAWGGDWVAADTAVSGSFKGGNDFRYMIPMNDSGLNGDKVAGDNIWSTIVTFPVGTAGGNTEYKFGAWYEGAAEIKPSQPMDNEGLFGTNHNFKIAPSNQVVNAYNVWGDFENETDVRQVETGIVPGTFELSQNYPNPFNPSTVIEYSIPEMAAVQLSIFNVLGQEVRTLVNQEQTAGTYRVDFNAGNMSSGIYFYTLKSGQTFITKKMMLLK